MNSPVWQNQTSYIKFAGKVIWPASSDLLMVNALRIDPDKQNPKQVFLVLLIMILTLFFDNFW